MYKKNLKKSSLNNIGLLFSERENFLYKLMRRLSRMKHLDKIPTREPTSEVAGEATKHKKSKLKLQRQFINEGITNGKHKLKKHLWIILGIRFLFFIKRLKTTN